MREFLNEFLQKFLGTFIWKYLEELQNKNSWRSPCLFNIFGRFFFWRIPEVILGLIHRWIFEDNHGKIIGELWSFRWRNIWSNPWKKYKKYRGINSWRNPWRNIWKLLLRNREASMELSGRMFGLNLCNS